MSELPSTCDTSVLVPALLPTHEQFVTCRAALGGVLLVPAHVLLETFSVLTALPGQDRVPPRAAAEAIAALGWKVLQLPGEACVAVIEQVATAGRSGGAVYDAQIAATAAHHGVKILSRDRRAAGTYAAVGVEFELL